MSLQTIRRAGEFLALFTTDAPEWGVTEAAERTRLPKTIAHAQLSSLTEIGLLRRTAQNRYRLGWRILDLSRTLDASTAFRQTARPVMRALADSTGETVHLAILEDGRAVYVEKIEGRHGVQIGESHIGAQLPAHCSGVGKVLLAFRPWTDVERIIREHGLASRTPHTITSPDVLRLEITTVRRQRLAYDHEEAVLGIACVAAPVFGANGLIACALSLSAPAPRYAERSETYRQAVTTAATRLSTQLGGRP
ncbi:HTH-type transcriptional regulator XynR [Paraconexibacter sp. AEG42_29]|uniref:HTH-type transcriptional regulator XynR n=1 Tax=Paraconexibacter sp. AEG42_29 TaxID=2997339 RepID=A0AAU7B103_9ACTN